MQWNAELFHLFGMPLMKVSLDPRVFLNTVRAIAAWCTFDALSAIFLVPTSPEVQKMGHMQYQFSNRSKRRWDHYCAGLQLGCGNQMKLCHGVHYPFRPFKRKMCICRWCRPVAQHGCHRCAACTWGRATESRRSFVQLQLLWKTPPALTALSVYQ